MKYVFAAIYLACLTLPIVAMLAVFWFGWRRLYRQMKTQPSWAASLCIITMPLLWIGLVAVHQWVPSGRAALGVVSIILPHLFGILVMLVPFALLPRAFTLHLLLGCSTLLFGLAFVPSRWYPSPAEHTR